MVFIQNHRAGKHFSKADTRLAEISSGGIYLLQSGSAQTTFNRRALFTVWCLCLIVYRWKQWDVLSHSSAQLRYLSGFISSHRRSALYLVIWGPTYLVPLTHFLVCSISICLFKLPVTIVGNSKHIVNTSEQSLSWLLHSAYNKFVEVGKTHSHLWGCHMEDVLCSVKLDLW